MKSHFSSRIVAFCKLVFRLVAFCERLSFVKNCDLLWKVVVCHGWWLFVKGCLLSRGVPFCPVIFCTGLLFFLVSDGLSVSSRVVPFCLVIFCTGLLFFVVSNGLSSRVVPFCQLVFYKSLQSFVKDIFVVVNSCDLFAKSSVVPQWPSQLRDRWDRWEWSFVKNGKVNHNSWSFATSGLCQGCGFSSNVVVSSRVHQNSLQPWMGKKRNLKQAFTSQSFLSKHLIFRKQQQKQRHK